MNFPLAFSAAWGHVTAAPNLNSGQEPRGPLAASFERLVGAQPWGPALAGCKGGRRAPCPDHERGQCARDRVINLAWPGLAWPGLACGTHFAPWQFPWPVRPRDQPGLPMARSAERPTWPAPARHWQSPRQLEAAGRLRRSCDGAHGNKVPAVWSGPVTCRDLMWGPQWTRAIGPDR